jgi:hypothetical protein
MNAWIWAPYRLLDFSSLSVFLKGGGVTYRLFCLSLSQEILLKRRQPNGVHSIP